MFNKSKLDSLVPEKKTEKTQEFLLKPERGCSSPASFEASGSNMHPFQDDQKMASYLPSKKIKMSSEQTIEDNDQPLDLSRRNTCGLSDQPLDLSRRNTCGLSDQTFSTNTEQDGRNHKSKKEISSSTSKPEFDNRCMKDISREYSVTEHSHSKNQAFEVGDEFGKNSHINIVENTAWNINISKIIENKNTDAFCASGGSKEENARQVDDAASIPGPSRKQPFKCPVCKKELDEHASLLDWKKAYKCCFCRYITDRRDNFSMHLCSHGPNPFFCKECEEIFKENGSHDIQKTCELCEKTFPCMTRFIEHSTIHTLECIMCWRGFDKHIIEFGGGVPYKCCKCDHKTPEKQSLWLHVYTHFKEKAFKCDECGKRYTHSSTLNAHKLMHKGNLQ